MNKQLVNKIQELLNSQTPFIISTIVKFIGSTPRKVEAKMITYLGPKGIEIFDTIGGGRLEKEGVEDALALLKERGLSYTKLYALDETFSDKAHSFLSSIR